MRKKILKNKNPLCSTKQLRLTFVERKKKYQSQKITEIYLLSTGGCEGGKKVVNSRSSS